MTHSPAEPPMFELPSSYYRHHVFVCRNLRDNGEACCQTAAEVAGVDDPVKFLRDCLRPQGRHGKGRVRINRAGCLDRCPRIVNAPALVVYPDNVWYRYRSAEDLRRIAEQHLIKGNIVEDLRLSVGDD